VVPSSALGSLARGGRTLPQVVVKSNGSDEVVFVANLAQRITIGL
jgi:hypothetical protein